MRRLSVLLIIVGMLLAGGVLYVVVHASAGHYLNASSSTNELSNIRGCSRNYAVRQVTIQHDTVTPMQIQARLCDTLLITNLDDKVREIGFGAHDHHQPYNGVLERLLNKDQYLTVVLNQAGNFSFHDHLQDTVRGTFTVAR